MRKLLIAALLALAASSSLRSGKKEGEDIHHGPADSRKEPDSVKLDISAGDDTIKIAAFLPGQDKPQEFTITRESLHNGGKVSVDLPGGSAEDIKVQVTEESSHHRVYDDEDNWVKTTHGEESTLSWEAPGLYPSLSGSFETHANETRTPTGNEASYGAKLSVPGKRLEVEFDENATISREGNFTVSQEVGISGPRGKVQFENNFSGKPVRSDKDVEVEYAGKFSFNEIRAMTVGPINLRQCLNVCFEKCQLANRNCFQSCSSNCLALNAHNSDYGIDFGGDSTGDSTGDFSGDFGCDNSDYGNEFVSRIGVSSAYSDQNNGQPSLRINLSKKLAKSDPSAWCSYFPNATVNSLKFLHRESFEIDSACDDNYSCIFCVIIIIFFLVIIKSLILRY